MTTEVSKHRFMATRRAFCAGLSAVALLPTSVRAAELPKATRAVVTPPRITGPIPTTATSFPFGTSQNPGSYSATLMKRHDYVEEEYFVSGSANIYGPGKTEGLSAFSGDSTRNFATAKMEPLAGLFQAAAPYTTRMLLVRPRDNGKFSGRVHLYAFHNLAAQMTIDRNLLENGDAIACIEGCSGTRFGAEETPTGGIVQLHKFNPERYREMKLTNASPAAWPDLTPGTLGKAFGTMVFGSTGSSSDIFLQEIYRSYAQGPDIVTQMAHAFKTGNRALPFGNKVRGLYSFGASGGTTFLQPYIQYHHNIGFLPDGRPPFDGYLAMVGMIPEIMPKDAVFVYMTGQGDLRTTIKVGLSIPPDSDSPRVRVYEVPATGHGISGPLPEVTAARASTETRGAASPMAGLSGFGGGKAPPGVLPYDKVNAPIIWALWDNMYEWVEKGVPMPRAPRITRDSNAPDGMALDKYGHALGGLRTPWVDVPEGTYISNLPNSPLSAGIRPFTEETIKELYGSRENYLRLVGQKIDGMVKNRLVRPEHAALMLQSA